VTALQDWLSTKPVDPVKTFIRDALRTLTADEPAKTDEPQLLERGIERC
jgi:hypothetical protein